MIITIILISIFLSVLAVNLYLRFSPQFGKRPDRKYLQSKAVSAYYDGKKFRNETDKPVILPNSVWKILRLQFKKNPGRVPVHHLPSVFPAFTEKNNEEDLEIIWLGHSTVCIRLGNTIIFTDPVIGKRASPLAFAGPKAFPVSTPFSAGSLPLPDMIVISHDHFDHLDYNTIRFYAKRVKTFFVPLGVSSHLVKWGVPIDRITEFDWGESYTTDSGIQLIASPARHFSGRRRQENSTLWCSWILKNPYHSIFFSGDSGYGPHFKNIGEKHGPFEITFIECGGYSQFWPDIHMLPEQSARAHVDLCGKILIPIHWCKFNLAFHPWKEPVDRLIRAADKMNIDLMTPLIGKAYKFHTIYTRETWWKDFDQ
jgi:L-ascorbate metabolism protein UlaG (beta-lactamase superfamily)